MRMIDLGSYGGPLGIIDTSTAVDCSKDVRFRRSFRSLVECMVPCCGFQPAAAADDDSDASTTTTSTSTVTGTFFGYRRGRVSFCLHDDSSSSRAAAPLLLLEFAVPTAYLAREMQHGLLRIALECDRDRGRARPASLFGVPAWSMYCNGRKVGFAVRRQMSEGDAAVFKLMQSMSVGAGVLPGESKSGDGDLMYLRASFERVIGSVDSESFHMINPVGSTGQQLSIFLLRT
ncbi:protein MIZU-KUSSEI 1-like [Phoenix dactylifera]|uniref:Protein MIZU-KUSSEI 1-like n=1 Tax=Phoenix dactylifera TaxID=42345 RepID=A0A8B8ZTN1_PHODC|nr:protein MIZU-KUSSEI 1-like [Phoenix dactylifera]XP_038976722.1 protein MIZU-KUSSEI 1-like [Phoenix dactylifera]